MEPLIVPSSDDIEPFHVVENSKFADANLVGTGPGLSEVDEPESDDMAFSSSPVLYPASSSPAPMAQKPKRKLFQSFVPQLTVTKKARLVGGFEADDLDEVDSDLQDGSTTVAQETSAEPIALPRADQILAQPVMTQSSEALPVPVLYSSRLVRKTTQMTTLSGKSISIPTRVRTDTKTYEQTIAQRSTVAAGRAKTAYYGVDIHKLIDEAEIQKQLDEAAAELKQQRAAEMIETTEIPPPIPTGAKSHQMWTEKYRAKKFTDLVGDERTHRSVLRWLKTWDSIVFPGMAKLKPKRIHEDFDQDKQHKKVLLLTGPPGLGKTTLAHVCAKQAGYEVLEINASDDRSRDVVRGRIKDVLGTETVRGIQEQGKARKAGRPVCVVVDEVDGVVSGAGGSGGEGGFMKALIDLIHLDQRNSSGQSGQKKKGDKFRQMRPLIMICNDVYAPSLRPLRQSGLAEIVHVRKPALDKVISRLKSVFDKEAIACDNDAIRRLCESSWGLGTRKQNSSGGRGAGDGDIRSILVQGEWAAHKLRASTTEKAHLTRKWVEAHIGDSAASQKALGRGGIREVVERVFVEGAGLPNLPTKLSAEDTRLVAESKSNPVGVADLRKRSAIDALREMINTCGEHDRLMTDLFATYPTQVFQDDTFLSKPNASYEWLNFHDRLSSRIYSGQEWELNAYMSTGACGFHDLFAATDRGAKAWHDDKQQHDEADEGAHPFAGPKADFAAYEAEKANRTVLTEMQSNFSAPVLRLFSSVDAIATELVPNVAKMLAPEVKPVVVGGSTSNGASTASVRKESEKACVRTAVRVMHGLGIEFEKIRIEHEGGGAHSNGGYALRMEPPIDMLTTFHFSKTVPPTSKTSISSSTALIVQPTAPAPVRYAIRQVLSQELYKEKAHRADLARQARNSGLQSIDTQANDTTSYNDLDEDKENTKPQAKKPISTQELISSKSLSSNINLITVKKDFFGRPILTPSNTNTTSTNSSKATGPVQSKHVRSRSSHQSNDQTTTNEITQSGQRTWVSFHEGYSNAVRKYISLNEFLDGF